MPLQAVKNEFNVVQYLKGGLHEYVARNVSASEAVEIARRYCARPAALIGAIARVIITDGDDAINFEWKFGEGVVFPPREGEKPRLSD